MDTKLLDKVEAIGSSNQKKILLSGLKEDTLRFLRLALDPGVTFGVTVEAEKKLGSAMLSSATSDPVKWWNQFYALCLKLKERKLTGNAAQEAISDCMWHSNHNSREDDVKWACRILNKDLRCGFSYSTLNKVFPQSIDKMSCSLAEPFDPDKHELVGEYIADRKLDGMRMLIIDGVAYSRGGKIIHTVGHILQEIEKVDPDGRFVLDGEVMGSADFDTNSGATRRQSTGTNTDLVYNVFDCIDREAWRTQKTVSLKARKDDLTHLLGGSGERHPHVFPVPYEILPLNPKTTQLFEMRDKLIAQGFEGMMLKKFDSPYVFKRSDAILKFKDFKDVDGQIVEFLEGKGRHKGRLGAIRVQHESPAGTTTSKVGSGFDDEQREFFWKNQKKLTGKMVEVQYQNFSADGSLRFPIYVKLRPDKD
ncbi:MAG: ATP-dependent DNA ligase [Acidiferrobacterales bacterium]